MPPTMPHELAMVMLANTPCDVPNQSDRVWGKQYPQHDDARVSSQDGKIQAVYHQCIVPIVDVDSIDLVFAIIEESAML